MLLDLVIADLLVDSPALKNVPRPIIDAVVRATLDSLSQLAPDDVTIAEVADSEWHLCEMCRQPSRIGECTDDEDGVCLCSQCAQDALSDDAQSN